MKIALTILFGLFAAYSLVGAASDEKADTRKNMTYCSIILIIAIVLMNLK